MRMFTHTQERERERKRQPHTKPCTPDRAVASRVPRRRPFRSVAWPAAAAAALPHLVLGSSAAVGANCRRHSRQPHRSSCARTGPGQQAVRGDLGPERGRYGQSAFSHQGHLPKFPKSNWPAIRKACEHSTVHTF